MKIKEKEDDNSISVSKYLDNINQGLKNFPGRILGEITEVQPYPGRSYLFFKIKDKDENDPAILTCIMWKTAYALSGVEITPGLEVIISGIPSIYKPLGRFSFNAKAIELVGEGALRKQYEKLKAQLQKEGLFDESKKRPLPVLPQKIGLITSKEGAAIGDFQVNLGKFGFKILFIDSRVEGQLATEELLNSVRSFRNKDIETLVLIRGGGSLESLQPFNNEALVREIASFPVPVLVGVGHEKDISLVALAADKMVSTPTATANILNETWEKVEAKLDLSEQKIFRRFQETIQSNKDSVQSGLDIMKSAFQIIFTNFSKAEDSLRIGLKSIKDQIVDNKNRIDGVFIPVFRKINFSVQGIREYFDDSMKGVVKRYLSERNRLDELLISFEKQLTSNDPKRQLKLGYSIVTKNGRILKNTSQIKKGDVVSVGLSDGTFDSEIKFIKSN
ncbi:MAG: exodeoxyribonuclease VII large subunit [Candidatus Paceibacterota bacterium]